MMDSTVARTPAFSTVWKEQLRVVGLAIRRESVGALALLALLCVSLVAIMWIPALSLVVDGVPVDTPYLDPGEPPFGIYAVLAALIFAFLVWKGERPFGHSPLWSLPVDHRRHALTKVATGWVWLMAILGAALLCAVLTGLAIGARLGVDEVRVLILDVAGAAAGAEGATQGVPWVTPWWQWVLPFTSATAVYLLVSALIAGTAHPIRWAVVIWVLMGVTAGIAGNRDVDWITDGFNLLAWFAGGDPYTRAVRLASGEGVEAWVRLPTMKMFIASATFWIGLGLAAVVAAATRRRDH